MVKKFNGKEVNCVTKQKNHITDQSILKHDKLNRARFCKYNHCDYRVQLLLNAKLGKLSSTGEILSLEEIQRKQVLTAEEYSIAFKTSKSTAYKALQNSITPLLDAKIELEDLNSKSILGINFCSSAIYRARQGELVIRYTEEILPYLFQHIKRYVLYPLRDLSNFKSLYSVRLYELLQGYKYTGWMQIKIDTLRTVFNVGPRLQKYNHFKTYTFLYAVNEINKYFPDLNLHFVEIYEKRKVGSIKFLFNAQDKPHNQKYLSTEEIERSIPKLPQIPLRPKLTKYDAKEKLRLQEKRKAERDAKKLNARQNSSPPAKRTESCKSIGEIISSLNLTKQKE